MYSFRRSTLAFALVALLGTRTVAAASSRPVALPEPKQDAALAPGRQQVAVFAGGCFWGIEAVFEHVKGVSKAVSGYSGGSGVTARYGLVSAGVTGHAEAVRVVYDPAVVSYGQLLKVYFSVAHDPTQRDRQGPDVGPQYRSEIFTTSVEQQALAKAYIRQLTVAKVFAAPIATRLGALKAFYQAEAYHQDYLRKHPHEPYIVYNDAPKLVHLKQLFPRLYKG